MLLQFFSCLRGLVLAAVLTALTAGTSRAALVQYWTLDDGAGTTAANSISGGNTGLLVPGTAGPTWTSTGLAGPLTARSFMPSTSALQFNPSNPDYVDLGVLGLATTPTTGAASVSLWLNANSLTGDNRLWSPLAGTTSQGGAPRVVSSGAIEIWNGGSWLSLGPSGTITTNTWYHLAMAWDNDQVTAYVNGNLVGTNTSRFDFGTEAFGLGARYVNTHGTGFSGMMDDVSIWDHTLSAAEVLQLASGAPLLSPPIIPEPSTALLLAAGLVVAATRRRMRRGG